MALPVSISPTQSNAQTAVRSFLLAVLPGIAGQSPAVFQGTISGTTLTANALPGLPSGGIQGSIAVNAPVLGAAPGTTIQSQLSGTSGGVGTYQVSVSQTVAIPATMATGISVVAAQPNRVVEPNNPWFVVMSFLYGKRLGTNQDSSADAKFTGSIAGNTLTVSAVQIGTVSAGSTIFSNAVSANTQIISQLTGTSGGAGTYQVSPSQTVSSGTMSAGTKTMFMSSEATVQLDFHSPDYLAGDFAQTVSISFRDEYATTFFSSLTAPQNNVSPLYADDPRQAPFINAENQYEWRWSLDAHVQIDETVAAPQEYADSATVTLDFLS